MTILCFGCFLAPVSVAHVLAPSTYHTAFTPCSTFPRRKSVLRAAVISTRTPSPDEVDELQVSAVPEEEKEKKRTVSQNERADNLRQLRRVALARRRQAITEQEDEERDRRDKSFLTLALIPCLAAFVSWEQLSLMVAKFTDVYGVLGTEHGTEFANNLLRPTITGVVVPVASIAFATLLSTTVSVLRQRQVDLRVLLNKEACDLRLLRRVLYGMFGTRQHAGRRTKSLTLLTTYVGQLLRECNEGAIVNLEELELSGGIATNELDQITAMLHGVDGAAVSRKETIGAADDIIARLNDLRSERVALLLTDFPDLHYIVLVALSVSLCAMFLLESNQLVNQYLNSIQLRSLFALLVGIFSATAELCVDLDDPFRGSFSITSASTQIGDLVLCLQEDVREAKMEAGEISTATRRFLHSRLGGPSEGGPRDKYRIPKQFSSGIDVTKARGAIRTPSRYGALSTMYFHLLTGPLGSNVRALGDIAAWMAALVMRPTRALISWRRWPWRRKRKEMVAH